MALNLGDDVIFEGPALPEAFVRHELERQLGPALPKEKAAGPLWETYRRALRQPLTGQSGRWRVKNVVLDPLAGLLGYEVSPGGEAVVTREGPEGPGLVLRKGPVAIRAFPVDYQGDLDAPAERGQTYRFTPQRVAQRILLSTGERVGVLTNGDDLRLLLSDPARPGSSVTFKLGAWRALSARDGVPDGFRLLLALLDPKLLAPQQGKDGEKPSKLQDLLDAARLKQGQITKDLRTQARQAVEQFIQGVLDHPANRERFEAMTPAERERLPRRLWREGLILVYRLLFILRGEASGAFRFAATSPWRYTYSPGYALSDVARRVLDQGADSGHYLEQGLRKLFEIFEKGLHWKEARIDPLGGRLFGKQETPLLSASAWDEIGCARLLDKLLWTLERAGGRGRRGGDQGPGRRRINYADLDVEDLGRVYEALLEREPGLATESMVRLRRAKLEVVVPAAQGQKYRPAGAASLTEGEDDGDVDEPEPEGDDADEESGGKKTKVEWVEDIVPRPSSPGTFYLRVGLGRKASGSYYTPESFVRFLVEETLRPQVDERSPKEDPQPREILAVRVLDPAMGSGHFLVGACRYLGERLYEASRACADLDLWDRIPADVAPYLPGRVQEGGAEVGTSAERARAICKRLVAIHCLYGVDRNALAVELAKVCLWLESQAEGMPLTFLDHRLVHGDSLTGPDWFRLTYYPGKQERIENLWAQGVQDQLQQRLTSVLQKIGRLQDTLGANPYEIADKQRLKAEVDADLFPFQVLSLIWSGGVMLGEDRSDDHGYAELLAHVSGHGILPETLPDTLIHMLERGAGLTDLPANWAGIADALTHQAERGEDVGRALCYDLTFPEVFFPTAVVFDRKGFHAVLGNPPWEGIDTSNKEFFAAFDFSILEVRTEAEESSIIERLLGLPFVSETRRNYESEIDGLKRFISFCYSSVNRAASTASAATPDMYQCFIERARMLLRHTGRLGFVVPSAFHSNEGAAGVRRLVLDRMKLYSYYCFENKKGIFDIHRSFKFAPVVAEAGGSTDKFNCGFYLHDAEWLWV